MKRYRQIMNSLAVAAAAFCILDPVVANDTAYVLQYEIRIGDRQPVGNVYFNLQPRDGVDHFDQQHGPVSRLGMLRMQHLGIRLFGADEESGDGSGNECGGLCVLLGLAVIGGSIYALQKEGELEECLIEGAITGYC